MITINDFKPIRTDVLETSGELTVNLFTGERTVSINYSSILTRLIQEAGRICESYASDLFIDWRLIMEALEDGTMESGSRLLGFHDSGVDEAKSVLYWYNETSRGRDHYSAIWRLDIDVELVAPGRERIGMKLYRVR
nr:MAG TPA: hypothetical protein [Caudoviricetes sp.]